MNDYSRYSRTHVNPGDYKNPYKNKQRGSGNTGFVVACVLVALVVLLPIFLYAKAYFSEDVHANCLVTDKDRASGSSGSDMRVYTENCGNFTVADSLVKGTWHSSDTYADIEPGKTYNFTTIGFRVPFFSMFPNILEVEEVS